MDSEIQTSNVTDRNIIPICVANVSICIHQDYCKTKTCIMVGDFADSALLVEVKMYQHEPRKITRWPDGTFSKLK